MLRRRYFVCSCMTVDQGAVHTFMAPTEGTVKLSGSGAVKSGAFPNLRAPERLSFPPEVNGNSQRFRTILCVIEGPPPCTTTRPNRLQSIDETSYVVCRTLVCISGPVSSLVRRLRGALINNRGAFQKSSGTRRILPTGLLTGQRLGKDVPWRVGIEHHIGGPHVAHFTSKLVSPIRTERLPAQVPDLAVK